MLAGQFEALGIPDGDNAWDELREAARISPGRWDDLLDGALPTPAELDRLSSAAGIADPSTLLDGTCLVYDTDARSLRTESPFRARRGHGDAVDTPDPTVPSTGRPWRLAPPTGARSSARAVETTDDAARYIVVEELLDDAVTLIVAPWPTTGVNGELVFEGAGVEAWTTRDELRSHIGVLEGTSVVPGDAAVDEGMVLFGRIDRKGPVVLHTDEGRLRLAGPWQDERSLLADITREGREAAEAAFFAASAPLLDRGRVADDLIVERSLRQRDHPGER